MSKMQALMLLTPLLCLIPRVLSSGAAPNGAGAGIATAHQLSPGKPRVFSITPGDTTTLTLSALSPFSSFVIVQVHTQYASLLLTQTVPPSGGIISGNSVGMVYMLAAGTGEWTVAVEEGSLGPEDNVSVPVLAVVQEYADNVPVPGACNQVFTLETDPNIIVTPDDFYSQVWFQWANVASPAGTKPPACEAKGDMRRLRYELYVAYTGEVDDSVDGLFERIRALMTVQHMQSNAMKVSTIENDGAQKSLVKVTSQRGQGAVYGVVVTDTHSGLAASYVAAVSYACNHTAGDCGLQQDPLEWVILVACGAAGLVLLILGHNFLKTELALMGFIAVTVVSFTLLSMAPTLSDPVRLGLAAGMGIVGGAGWLLVWVVLTFPSISVLLPGLCAGFLMAGALFFTPFANISWWMNSVNYGLVYVCVTLLFGVLFLCSPRTMNIVSCSLVGGYCVTMVAGIPLRSSLRLIVLNVIRHASVSDYTSVVVISPFLVADVVLTVTWVVLAAAAIYWQFHRARGKPHFPDQQRQRRCRNAGRAHVQGRGQQRSPSPEEEDDVRTPLIGSQTPPPSYVQSASQTPPPSYIQSASQALPPSYSQSASQVVPTPQVSRPL